MEPTIYQRGPKKILTIIPARGGSKGIPRKNIRMIAGKPLIAWTIEAALQSGVLTKVVVSTEDAQIAETAIKFGADVVQRPFELANDTALTEPVMMHALESVEAAGFYPDFVSLIQCTSPFLSPHIIQQAVKKVTDEGFDSAITVFYPDGYEFKWSKNSDGSFKCEHDPERRPRRQDMTLPYHENGAFYITRTDLFKKTINRFGGRDARVAAIEMEEADSLQIDGEHHLFFAEMYMRKKNGIL